MFSLTDVIGVPETQGGFGPDPLNRVVSQLLFVDATDEFRCDEVPVLTDCCPVTNC